MPSSIYRPQLAQLVKAPPDGDAWLHEVKYDGYRIGCWIRDRQVTLTSRNGKDWTATFPEITREILALGVRDALLDGELAVVLDDGRTSFQALQNASSSPSRARLAYFVFDAIRLGGESLTKRPLEERKQELLRLLGPPGPATRIRYSEHVVGRGAEMFAEACRLRLEGIISKRRDAPYTPGRGDTWLKTKCLRRQEFVVGGFTDPEGARQGIGALLIGYYDKTGLLVFAGKVGTGFTVKGAQDLRARLNVLEVKDCPFTPRPPGVLGRRSHWVTPALVADVTFSEWTEDGKVRHPSFQGLRSDKEPRTVAREIESDLPHGASNAPEPPAAPPAGTVKRGGRARTGSVLVAGMAITHPERILYPGTGVTKLDLARYYERVGEWMLPHLQDRPLTLVRCPDGIGGDCFYMKHSKSWAPPGVRRVHIQEKRKVGEYLVVDTVSSLVALAQMSVIEIHTWNSRAVNVEQPDRLVLDLDPGSAVDWRHVLEAARLVRRLLARAGLESFPKTTGGKGMHVVVPLLPSAGWEACLAFARTLAADMERASPDRYTTTFRKAGRERKILVDYLRNNRTNTSVAAYSGRAREGGTVSTPLRWSDLEPSLDPASFTLATTPGRLDRLRSDPWSGYWRARQRLPELRKP